MLAKQKIKWCSICSDYSVFLYFSRVSTRLGSNVLFEGRFFSKRLKNQKNSSKSILSKKPYLMDVLQFIVHFCCKIWFSFQKNLPSVLVIGKKNEISK